MSDRYIRSAIAVVLVAIAVAGGFTLGAYLTGWPQRPTTTVRTTRP